MKKLSTLHILNGDASVPAFTAADLPGQVLVWREILASGPVIYNLPEANFWDLRQQYITHTYQVTAEDYKKKVLDELPKIENASHFFEVVLWFDEDLVCQLNQLYLLYKFYKKQPAVVSLCTPKDSFTGNFKPEELQKLFEQRQMLDVAHLKQASELWQLYAGPDPLALQSYLQEHSPLSKTLFNALQLHLKRFPHQDTFLSDPHHLLLSSIKDGSLTLTEVQNSFWQSDPGYGFGDWQLHTLLKEMIPELAEFDDQTISLTEAGKQALEGKYRFEKDLTFWLGGVKIDQQHPQWCREEASQKIKLCTPT